MERYWIVVGALWTVSCGSAAPTGSTGRPTAGSGSSSSSGPETILESSSGSGTTWSEVGDSAGATSSTGMEGPSSSETNGSETSGGTCGCGEVQIGAGEKTPDGYSFLDIADEVPDADVAFTWVGIEGDPITTLHIHVEPLDGTASYQEGCGDCVGISGRALLVIDSDDGFLDESMAGYLSIVPGESASLDIVSNHFDEYMGTLPDQAFDQVTDNAGVAIAWDLSDPDRPPSVSVYSPGGFGAFEIGETVPRE